MQMLCFLEFLPTCKTGMFHELATILAKAMLKPSALFQSHAALLGQALREAARQEASTVSYF